MGAPVGALIGMREQENGGFEGEKAMNIESSRGIHSFSQFRVQPARMAVRDGAALSGLMPQGR